MLTHTRQWQRRRRLPPFFRSRWSQLPFRPSQPHLPPKQDRALLHPLELRLPARPKAPYPMSLHPRPPHPKPPQPETPHLKQWVKTPRSRSRLTRRTRQWRRVLRRVAWRVKRRHPTYCAALAAALCTFAMPRVRDVHGLPATRTCAARLLPQPKHRPPTVTHPTRPRPPVQAQPPSQLPRILRPPRERKHAWPPARRHRIARRPRCGTRLAARRGSPTAPASVRCEYARLGTMARLQLGEIDEASTRADEAVELASTTGEANLVAQARTCRSWSAHALPYPTLLHPIPSHPPPAPHQPYPTLLRPIPPQRRGLPSQVWRTARLR